MTQNPDFEIAFSNKRVSLKIPEAFEEDSGSYECRATNQAGTARSNAELVVKGQFCSFVPVVFVRKTGVLFRVIVGGLGHQTPFFVRVIITDSVGVKTRSIRGRCTHLQAKCTIQMIRGVALAKASMFLVQPCSWWLRGSESCRGFCSDTISGSFRSSLLFLAATEFFSCLPDC